MLSLFIFCVIFVFPDQNNLTSKQAIPVNGVKLLTSEYYNIDIAIAKSKHFLLKIYLPCL